MDIKTVLQALPYGAVYLDEDRQIGLINQAAEQLLGLAGAEQLGRTAVPLIEGLSLEPGATYTCSQRGTPIRVTITALGAGLLVSYQDLTLLRPAQKYLQIIRHALIEPLTPLQGFADLLDDERLGPLNEEQHTMLSTIRINARRMLNTVLALHQLDLLDNGYLILKPGPLDLLDLVQQTVRRIESMASERGVTITVRDVPDLPGIWGDADKLRQVLAALLDNACRFSSAGGQIDLRLAAQSNHIQVDLQDYGKGIRADWQPYVFERFFYGYVDIAYQGSGCSLAIARQIIELHGGAIAFTSHEGQGSTFSFTLPLGQPR